MPSVSPKQHRFMEAIAHSPEFARKAGVPRSVGQDFAQADQSVGPLGRATQHFAIGGPAMFAPHQGIAPPPNMMALLQGQRPGVPNPQQPIQHPMSPMMNGAQGAMQGADRSMMGIGPRLNQMRAYARGGHVHQVGAHGLNAIHHAIHHLKRGDGGSAIAALQSSPDAMAHPDVQSALAQLGGGAMGPGAAGGGGDPTGGGEDPGAMG